MLRIERHSQSGSHASETVSCRLEHLLAKIQRTTQFTGAQLRGHRRRYTGYRIADLLPTRIQGVPDSRQRCGRCPGDQHQPISDADIQCAIVLQDSPHAGDGCQIQHELITSTIKSRACAAQ